jgi:hypothetical protein
MPMPTPQPPFGPADSNSPFAAPPRAKRPGGLTAICIIAIVLGALGLLASLKALAGVAFQQAASEAFVMQQQPGVSPEFVEANNKMQQEALEVTHRFWGLTAGVALANLAISAGLLAGAILMLKMNDKARGFLVAVLAVAILFEVIQACVYVFMQLQLAPILSESMPTMMKSSVPAGQPGAQQIAEMGTVVAKAAIFAGIAFQMVFGLAKLIYYAVATRYLCKPRIRALCEPVAADPS